MIDPIRELKVRAEVLDRRARDGDTEVLSRLRALPEFRKATDAELNARAPSLQRKHWLAVVALEAGFKGWEHAARVLGGDAEEADFGRLLYPSHFSAHLNVWCSTYDEARSILDERGSGYLLAYGRQFFLAEPGFVEALGLDPADTDWSEIGFDWAKPKSVEARSRLYGKLIASRLPRADAA